MTWHHDHYLIIDGEQWGPFTEREALDLADEGGYEIDTSECGECWRDAIEYRKLEEWLS